MTSGAINSFTPVTPEVLDSGVKDAFDSNVDTTFAAMYDLPIVPYYYTMANGTKKLMCAFQVATSYIANKSKLSTINFGSMCWGNTIGISSSFFDNHAIIPMNNDQVKRSTLLTQTTVGTPGYIDICYQLSNNADTGINYPIIVVPEEKRKWLIQLIDDSKVLWGASSGGHVGVVEKILEVVGINVNVVMSNGTPLCVARRCSFFWLFSS